LLIMENRETKRMRLPWERFSLKRSGQRGGKNEVEKRGGLVFGGGGRIIEHRREKIVVRSTQEIHTGRG